MQNFKIWVNYKIPISNTENTTKILSFMTLIDNIFINSYLHDVFLIKAFK